MKYRYGFNKILTCPEALIEKAKIAERIILNQEESRTDPYLGKAAVL